MLKLFNVHSINVWQNGDLNRIEIQPDAPLYWAKMPLSFKNLPRNEQGSLHQKWQLSLHRLFPVVSFLKQYQHCLSGGKLHQRPLSLSLQSCQFHSYLASYTCKNVRHPQQLLFPLLRLQVHHYWCPISPRYNLLNDQVIKMQDVRN